MVKFEGKKLLEYTSPGCSQQIIDGFPSFEAVILFCRKIISNSYPVYVLAVENSAVFFFKNTQEKSSANTIIGILLSSYSTCQPVHN